MKQVPFSRVLELRRGKSSTSAGAKNAPVHDPGVMSSEVTDNAHGASPGLLAASAFRYTQTRTFRSDEKVLEQHRVMTGRGSNPAIAGYKILRTQVLQRLREHGWSTLGVTSPRASAGKTLTAINLAIIIARDISHSALLVDLDLTRPAIADHFGFEPEFGIGDVILGAASLESALFHPSLGRLVVLPGKGSLDGASELITAPQVTELVSEMKGRYTGRIVVFDLPAVLEGDEVLAFAPQVDAFLMVVDERHTRRPDLEQAVELLPAGKLMGTVLNRAAG